MCCQKTFDRTRALFYQVQIHYHNCYLCEEKFVAQIVSVSMMSLDKITIKSSVETVLRGILEGHCHVGVFIIAYLGRSAFNSHFKQISIPDGATKMGRETTAKSLERGSVRLSIMPRETGMAWNTILADVVLFPTTMAKRKTQGMV